MQNLALLPEPAKALSPASLPRAEERPHQAIDISAKCSWYGNLFLQHKNAKFAHKAEVAFRGAVCCVILALPHLVPGMHANKAELWEAKQNSTCVRGWEMWVRGSDHLSFEVCQDYCASMQPVSGSACAKQNVGIAPKGQDKCIGITFSNSTCVLCSEANDITNAANNAMTFYEYTQGVYHAVVLEGYYSNSALVMFIFTLYTSVGETINYSCSVMIGTIMASINIVVMFSIFPHGVTPHTGPEVVISGVIDGLLFLLAILLLNFGLRMKMFALSWHVYFMMEFLNDKTVTTSFSGSSGWNAKGPALAAIIQSFIGMFFAILASLVPYPMFALDAARAKAEHINDVLEDAWRTAATCFVSKLRDRAREDHLWHNVNLLQSDMVKLSSDIQNAWWECGGYGRKQKVRAGFKQLGKSLQESYDRLNMILYSLRDEDYDNDHDCLVESIVAPLTQMSVETGLLMRALTKATSDGTINEREDIEIRAKQARVKELLTEFTMAFLEHPASMDVKTAQERAICLDFCAHARIGIEFADFVLNLKQCRSGQTPITLFKGIFDKKKLFEKNHLNFFLRNSITLIVTFAIGYIGYGDTIKCRNSGLASTVALLLSSFVGSAVTKILGRLQGVILGLVIGQLGYAALAWCTFYGYLLTGVFLFGMELFTLFVYYHSSEFGFVGCFVAAFAAQNLITGCSNEVFQPSRSYLEIIDCVLGISVMTVVDSLLSHSRTSDLALEALDKLWDNYTDSCKEIFDPRVKDFKFDRVAFLKHLADAGSYGEGATKEPRWWRTPWRLDLWRITVSYGYQLRVRLNIMACSISQSGKEGSPKSKKIMQLMERENFQEVSADMMKRILQVSKVLEIFMKETGGEWENRFSKTITEENRQQERFDVHRLREDLLNQCPTRQQTLDLVKDWQEEGKLVTLENEIRCKLSSFIGALDAQMEDMSNLKHAIMSAA